MQNLIDFLYRFRTFGLFLILEVLCAWLIIGYNQYYNASFLNSSNTLAGSFISFSSNTSRFIDLEKVNKRLLDENKMLREQLANTSLQKVALDSFEHRYSVIQASVLNQTFRKPANYITLDAGKVDGITPGMGVISEVGVVGQVKSVSRNFATVTSLLHPKLLVSAALKKSATLGTVQWEGGSELEASLKYVPRHIDLAVGDTIVTSGFNAVFPANILLGVVKYVSLDIQDAFYDAKIELATDFTSLSYVYVFKHNDKNELDSLQNNSQL